MVTLQPTGNRWAQEVRATAKRRSHKEGEFDTQASLYVALKAAGAKVRAEVTVRGKEPHQGERGRWQCRFDLAIFEGEQLAHIIECKAAPVRHKNGLEETRQCRRYRSFGVPVTFIYGPDDADEFVRLYRQTGGSNGGGAAHATT